MGDIINFNRQNSNSPVTYRGIWEGTKGERGEQVILAHGVWENGINEYAIIYMAPEGSPEGIDIIRHFNYDEASLALAKICAEVADRALGAFIMSQPEDEECA